MSVYNIRNNFSKFDNFNSVLSDVFAIQRKSYNDFLFDNEQRKAFLKRSLEAFFPISDSHGYSSLEFVSYRVQEPVLSPIHCITKSVTYACDVYVTLRFVCFSFNQNGERELKSVIEQEVLLCSVPKMTEDGIFIVNGVQRTVVSQIHKSPGVFFSREFVDNGFLYSASIIPYKGKWIDIFFDQKDSLCFKIDKKKKFPINHLLKCFSFDNKFIIEYFYKALNVVVDGDRFKVKFNLEDHIGSSVFLTLRDNEMNPVLNSGSIVSKSTLRKIKSDEFFFTHEDLVASESLLYSDVSRDGSNLGFLLDSADATFLKNLKKFNVKSFEIINKSATSYSSSIINSILANKSMDREDCLYDINTSMSPGEQFVKDTAIQNFEKKFFSIDAYDLHDVGRYKINSTLGLEQINKSLTLTTDDILLTVKKLINLKESLSETDDIDHLGNRRVRSVGELIEAQFQIGLSKMSKFAVDKLNSVILDATKPSDLIISNYVSKPIKDFFMSSQLSQFLEQTNLLSEISHKRKISSLGAGGVKKERAGFDVRDIHHTHYSKICPIETPDGQGVGLIMNLASYAKINEYGFIEAPYRVVENGKISSNIKYIDSNMESSSVISSFLDFYNQDTDLKVSRVGSDFALMEREKIQYTDVSPRQLVSVVTSLIPFLECNDTARALMGCNMQKQSVPLLNPDNPYVATGMEHEIVKDSGAVITAKHDGIVKYVDADFVIISKTGDVSSNIVDIYKTRKFEKTNQNTTIIQKPIVSIGDIVKAGDILTDGPCVKDMEVSIGKNVLVAFMPWRGYNYEDSIVVSDALINEDKFTSIHIEVFECKCMDTKRGAEQFTKDIYTTKTDSLRYLDESGIVHIGTHVGPSDILVGKISPKEESPMSPEEKLLKAIFGDKVSDFKDSSLRVSPGVSGVVVGSVLLTRRGIVKKGRAKEMEFDALKRRKFEYESTVNIISKTFDDLIISEIGDVEVLYKTQEFKVSSGTLKKTLLDKKNVSVCKNQSKKSSFDRILLEYRNTLIGLNKDYLKDVERIMDGDDLPNGVLSLAKVFVATKSKLQSGDKMSGRHGNKGVVSVVLKREDMPYMADGRSVDIVLSPISVPGRMNIGQILETHLGLVSYGVGRKVNQMIEDKDTVKSMKKKLGEILSDDRLKKYFDSISDEQFMEYMEKSRDGFYFKLPVFESPSHEAISELAKKVDLPADCQVDLYDGFTGEKFDRKVTVGYMYMMKLHHLVDNKMHARSVGPYSLVTQQPLGGKSHFGGQRLGEMECWALQAYGAAYTLQEMLTVKSDDIEGRSNVYKSIVKNQMKFKCGIPESFNVLVKELKSLGFDVELSSDAINEESEDQNNNFN